MKELQKEVECPKCENHWNGRKYCSYCKGTGQVPKKKERIYKITETPEDSSTW